MVGGRRFAKRRRRPFAAGRGVSAGRNRLARNRDPPSVTAAGH